MPRMEFLEILRKNKKLSQNAMAEFLDMRTSSYVYLEKRANGIQLDTLVRIKNRLGISWADLGKLIEKEYRDK